MYNKRRTDATHTDTKQLLALSLYERCVCVYASIYVRVVGVFGCAGARATNRGGGPLLYGNRRRGGWAVFFFFFCDTPTRKILLLYLMIIYYTLSRRINCVVVLL